MHSENIPHYMSAAVLRESGRIDIENVPVPEIGANEVLVKVDATGVCGSDLSTFWGHHPYKKAPTILGHEFSGQIVAVGSEVSGFSKGDRVCAAAYANCGQCDYCLAGRHNLCSHKSAFSYQGWGGSFAQYVMARPEKCYLLGANVDAEHGALVEPLAIALHALRLAPTGAGHLTVIGSGCIGLSAVLCAGLLGFDHIVATDIHPDKKALALRCGADDFTTDAQTVSAGDVTIVCASYPDAITDALSCTRAGGTIIVVSYFSMPLKVDINEIVKNEIIMIGSALAEDCDFLDIIHWMSDDKFNPSVMVTHRFPLTQAQQALELKANPQAIANKIILQINNRDIRS